MEKLHFKTNVQIKSIIGKDLINDDNIAILELVKNSFDADAKRVDISFCNLKSNDDKRIDTFSENTSRLFIRDDGVGMDLTDITDKWLNIAYSEKKSRTRQFNRMMAGAKGVGRFSCDRLGQFLRLYAKKNGKQCIVLNIDWRKFEIDDKTKEIQSVDINYELIDDNSLEQKGFLGFEHGVILEIIKLRSNWVYPEGSSWDTDKLSDLKKYLEKLINPNQAFEKNDFGIYLNAEEFLVENSQKAHTDQFIGKVENTIFQKLDFKTTSIECKSIEDGKLMLTTLKDKGETIYWIKELSEFYPIIRDFKITLYFLNTYAKAFFTKQTGMRSVSYGSVFLFLNGFRIPPYGEEGDDWLKLDQRRAQGYARFISARDIVGQIEILDNYESFKIVSSREGLVKNESFDKLTDRRDGLFYRVLRRLERYVVDGLNWDSIPEEDKNKIPEIEKKIISGELSENDLNYQEDSATKRRRIYESIHSLISASPKRVVELYINEDLIESKIAEAKQLAEQEFSKLMADFENKKISGEFLAQLLQKKAKESEALEKQLIEFSKYTTNEATAKAVVEIQTYKNLVEKQASIIKSLQEELEKKNKEIVDVKKYAEKKINEAQTRLAKKIEQLKIITSLSSQDLEQVTNLHHQINVVADNIGATITLFSRNLQKGKPVPYSDVIDFLNSISMENSKIVEFSRFGIKNIFDDFTTKGQYNIIEYLKNYVDKIVSQFVGGSRIRISFVDKTNGVFETSFAPIDISIIVDNMASNAKKAGADMMEITTDLSDKGLQLSFLSNKPFNQSIINLDDIFERGFSTTRSTGVGLYHIKTIVEENGWEIVANRSKNNAEFIITISL